jgi:hypothetical protein
MGTPSGAAPLPAAAPLPLPLPAAHKLLPLPAAPPPQLPAALPVLLLPGGRSAEGRPLLQLSPSASSPWPLPPWPEAARGQDHSRSWLSSGLDARARVE